MLLLPPTQGKGSGHNCETGPRHRVIIVVLGSGATTADAAAAADTAAHGIGSSRLGHVEGHVSSPDRTAAISLLEGERNSTGGCCCPRAGHGDRGMFKDGSESLLLVVLWRCRCGVEGGCGQSERAYGVVELFSL